MDLLPIIFGQVDMMCIEPFKYESDYMFCLLNISLRSKYLQFERQLRYIYSNTHNLYSLTLILMSLGLLKKLISREKFIQNLNTKFKILCPLHSIKNEAAS